MVFLRKTNKLQRNLLADGQWPPLQSRTQQLDKWQFAEAYPAKQNDLIIIKLRTLSEKDQKWLCLQDTFQFK